MKLTRLLCISALTLLSCAVARSQSSSEPSLPYSPSLNLESIDKSIDPCVNLYQYSCGRWQKDNPIPADQTSWSVYGKLYEDNLNFLHGILEQAAAPGGQRDAVNQKIGDFYAACIDETAIETRGIDSIKPDLERIAALKKAHDLAPLLANLHTTIGGRSLMFVGGADQDPDNSEHVIASLDQGGPLIGPLHLALDLVGQGDLRNRQDEALNFALSLNLLDAFTIGAESKTEQEDLIRRIAAA